MDLKITENLSSVDKVLSCNNFICYIQSNQLKFKESKLDLGNINYVYVHDEIIYGQDRDSLYEIDFISGQFNKILTQEANAYAIIDNNSILISKQIKGGYQLTKFQSEKREWSISFSGLYFNLLDKNYFFEKNGFKVSKFWKINLDDGTKGWSFEAKEGFTIGHNDLHIAGNILIVPQEKLSRPYKQVIVSGINLSNGEKLWEVDANGTAKYIVDKVSGKLYSLYSERSKKMIYLKSLNSINGEITLDAVAEDTDSDIVPWNARIKNELLYYSDNIIGGKIGVLDLRDIKILTQTELGLDEGNKLYEPHISNDSVYVLDTTKTLHMLEIEDYPA